MNDWRDQWIGDGAIYGDVGVERRPAVCWTCIRCKEPKPFDAIEVEIDAAKFEGVCLTCYLALQAQDSVEALGLRKKHEEQASKPVHVLTFVCVSCETELPLCEARLEFGQKRSGERWAIGYCRDCMDAGQLVHIERLTEKWLRVQPV